jgi:DNA-binding response OmpR family regulator
MKVLILEDDPERLEWFSENLKVEDVDVTDMAEDAMNFLKNNVYDIIFLDHDLGGAVYVDSSVFNTGFTVAKMIHETDNKNVPVVIHSWNSQGAKMMKHVMTLNKVENVYHPFLSVEFRMVVNQVNQKNEEN